MTATNGPKRTEDSTTRENEKAIVVVSGLPRSGTSLMMKMLEAGGVPLVVDNLRLADIDNPNGYYELESVKALDKGDVGWLVDAQGSAVKVISALLVHLPPIYIYRVIFMQRTLQEVIASQRHMLIHRNVSPNPEDEGRLTALYTRHLQKVQAWMAQQPSFSALTVDYSRLLGPGADADAAIDEIVDFLQRPLDTEKMRQAINPSLYRNRA